MMLAARTLVVLLIVGVALATPPHVRRRRQLPDDNTLQPIETGTTSHRHTRTANSESPTKLSLIGPTDPKGPTGPTDRPARQAAVPDDIPVFDRNKVSLDFPGNLFGPSVSLLIKTTKIIGDVIQNSAVRYQSFLRLFQPLFKGPFEIKGLDPPTTTTTTTTKAPKTSDNEVRRR